MIGCFVMKKPCIIYLFLKRNSQYKSNKEKKSYSNSCWRKGIDLWREMKSTKYVLLGKMRNCRELSLCI